MAGKSNTSATFFAQKKLLGKAHTSNLKVDGEEVIGSNIQSSTGLLFGEPIPNHRQEPCMLYRAQPVHRLIQLNISNSLCRLSPVRLMMPMILVGVQEVTAVNLLRPLGLTHINLFYHQTTKVCHQTPEKVTVYLIIIN